MERNSKALLLSTELKDRRLWFDGDSSYNPNKLYDLIQLYDVEYVDYFNTLVEQYNKQVSSAQQFKAKQECNPLQFQWVLPEPYLSLDVVDYVASRHEGQLDSEITQEEVVEREKRLANELSNYKQRGLFEVLRAVIYIINTLIDHNIVWGVGRGSSVSSYVLYVIGVHDVDSFAYQLDIDDFLHD